MKVRHFAVSGVFAGVALVASPLGASAQPASVSTVNVQGVQGIPLGVAAPGHKHVCNWHVWHRVDQYTSWRYVDPRLAGELHVGACSKLISGTDGSIVFTQHGYVAGAS